MVARGSLHGDIYMTSTEYHHVSLSLTHILKGGESDWGVDSGLRPGGPSKPGPYYLNISR